MMIIGLLLFFGVHAIPVWAPRFRRVMASRLGEWPWKGLFAFTSLIGMWMVVTGWQKMDPVFLYDLGTGVRHLMFLIMPVAFALFIAPYCGSNLRRWVRNQHYSAIKLWALGHLLANGDSRSLILFGGFLIWAVLMVIGVKRRDGAYEPPPKTALWRDALTLGGAVIAAIGFAYAHPGLFGVPVLP